MLHQGINNSSHRQRHITSLFAKDSYDDLELECTPVTRLSTGERLEINALFGAGYVPGKAVEIPDGRNGLQDTYVYRLYNNDRLIGSRQISIMEGNARAPQWVIEMLGSGFEQLIAIGSCTIVHPDYRNAGIGTFMIRKSNHDIFTQQHVQYILGSSTSIGTIALHLRLGARVWSSDIDMLPGPATPIREHDILKRLMSLKTSGQLLLQPLRYLHFRQSPAG